MGTFAEVLRYLLQSLLGVLLFAVLLRLLLQLVRADFYNPVSQLVVKVTNPLLRPLRRLIPPWDGSTPRAWCWRWQSSA